MALLVTLCLIGLLIAALLFMRRRGWITLPSVPRAAATAPDIQVRSSRRLSVATTAHVLSYQGQVYLVVESSRGTQATVTPMATQPAGDSGEVRP